MSDWEHGMMSGTFESNTCVQCSCCENLIKIGQKILVSNGNIFCSEECLIDDVLSCCESRELTEEDCN